MHARNPVRPRGGRVRVRRQFCPVLVTAVQSLAVPVADRRPSCDCVVRGSDHSSFVPETDHLPREPVSSLSFLHEPLPTNTIHITYLIVQINRILRMIRWDAQAGGGGLQCKSRVARSTVGKHVSLVNLYKQNQNPLTTIHLQLHRKLNKFTRDTSMQTKNIETVDCDTR